jgi:hypothetical protein
MEKKNYNIEIFFESQKKSFVILSKDKITFDEVKSRTIKEFNIPSEYEKDMRFSLIIKNRPTTILNDYQIMKNFEEISKNNFYIKINFSINNSNYVCQSTKIKYKKKQKIEKKEQFCILANIPQKDDKKENNNYIEQIKKLKNEIIILNNEKNKKSDFDIRKFDEKFRDLNNKNNDLEQKIFELESENKTLKIKQSKTNSLDFEKNNLNNNNDNLIKKIEKIFSKLISEHDKNMYKEIDEMKTKMNEIINGQKILLDNYKPKNNNIHLNDNNFEILNYDAETEKSLFAEKTENKDDKINKIIDIVNIDTENKINNEKNGDINMDKNTNKSNEKDSSNNYINLDNTYNNCENLSNIKDKIEEKEKKEIEEKIKQIDNIEFNKEKHLDNIDINKDSKTSDFSNLNLKIKRNINFNDNELLLNSKSFEDSTKIKIKYEKKNTFKEIKNSFLENNNNNIFQKPDKITLKNPTKYIIPNNFIDNEKIKIDINKTINKYISSTLDKTNNNNNHITKQSNLSDEDLINYESGSEIKSDLGNKHKIINYKRKGVKLKKEKIRNINKYNNYTLNYINTTPSPGNNISYMEKNLSYNNKNKDEKYEVYITPKPKEFNIKEDIDDYFINIFQSIFFYGNNGYVNMLNISDKLTKKIKDGLVNYRNNIKEVKNCTIKYISYSIIPIINDINTKEYQRKILKEKIKKILEYMNIETNYFEKEYKINKDENIEKSKEKNINGVNITHSKINEFRKCYDLKEKDYPDEMLIKALIRYRGNKEMAFQYLFY